MKKLGVWVVVLLCFSGCSNTSKEIERGMALRSRLLKSSSCSFYAEVTADYGDQLYTFGMSCQGDSVGDLTFTVNEPETISGITGTITSEGGNLTFDDTALHFERMADEQLTPVTAPWILLKTLRSGYLTSACEEDGLLRLTIDDSYEDDALTLDVWLDGNDLPVRSEILYDGRRILSLNVKNFVIA